MKKSTIIGMVVALIVIALIFFVSSIKTFRPMPPPAPGYTDVSAQKAKQLIDNNPDLIIIDVSPNYDEGHLPGAVNYYIGDGSLDAAIPTLDPEAMYLVYCHIGGVARAAADKLVNAGFKNVYTLEGNYQAWVDAGYSIETIEE